MDNFFINLITLSLFFSSLFADKPAILLYPAKINDNSLGIELTARAAMVRDRTSGAVLFSKNENEALPIASITKLMTALVFLDTKTDWEKIITITKDDYRNGNVKYLFDGDQVTVKDLFNLMLVASSNEAAAALAKSSGLEIEKFVELMNEKAQQLGLQQTHFFDPTGLPTENVSSADDISLLTSYVLNLPDIRESTMLKEYRFEILNRKIFRVAPSTNQLLSSFLNQPASGYQVVGGKTGYLNEALNCLTIEVSRNNQIIIITLLGSSTATNRWQEAKGLADWTFGNYQWPVQISVSN